MCPRARVFLFGVVSSVLEHGPKSRTVVQVGVEPARAWKFGPEHTRCDLESVVRTRAQVFGVSVSHPPLFLLCLSKMLVFSHVLTRFINSHFFAICMVNFVI